MKGIASNLKPVRTSKEARERGRAGGKKSAEARRMRKMMRMRLEAMLSMKRNGISIAEEICAALINEARKGNARAFLAIRDTIGEKPAAKASAEITARITVRWLE